MSLEQEEGTIVGDEALTNYITNFYKNMFGHPDASNINIDIRNASR